jgi:hypothetical protein
LWKGSSIVIVLVNVLRFMRIPVAVRYSDTHGSLRGSSAADFLWNMFQRVEGLDGSARVAETILNHVQPKGLPGSPMRLKAFSRTLTKATLKHLKTAFRHVGVTVGGGRPLNRTWQADRGRDV